MNAIEWSASIPSHSLVTSFPVFPTALTDGGDFAVLKFAAEETVGDWRPGFYRLDSDLVALNDALRDLQR